MRSLLVSTYEMGRQPFGIASAAAWLRTAGWDVACVDVAKEQLQEGKTRIGRPHRLPPADAHGHAPGGADHRDRAAGEPGGPHLRLRALRAAER